MLLNMHCCLSKVLAFSFLLIFAFHGKVSWARLKPLHIGGIFPINGTSAGWQGGQACQPAAMLALEDVNKRKDILPGYELSLTWNDSECNPGLGASVMYDLLYKPPQKLLLLGGCSTVCTTIAEAAKMWNLVVLSYGASSPALSDRNRFPTFFRTHPSATVHNPTRIKLFQKFGWTRIAILQQAEEVFITTVEDLEAKCSEAGIEVVTRQSFLNDPTDAIRNLVRQDARIIVGLFYVVAARRVLCEIYHQKLYGEAYQWFLIGWYEDNWYQINLKEENLMCNQEQMKIAAEGHMTTEALMWNQDNTKTISGMTSGEFKERLDKALVKVGYDVGNGRYPEGYQEAPLAYDAIWAAALALNNTMQILKQVGRTLEEFTYEDKEIATMIYSSMNSTQFLGISGTVAFSAKGDRIAWTQIEQMVNGSYVSLGYFDTHTNNLTLLKKERWIGGKPPPDRTVIRYQLRTVSLGLLASVCSISLVGILAAMALLAFMYFYRTKRLIRQSQPICNCMTLVGVCVNLSGAGLLGLDGRLVPSSMLGFICQLRAWLLTTGFSLSYGAMFAKIWSVHSLATKAKAQGTKPPSGPRRPWLMVVGFVVVDVVILTTWAFIDPLRRTLELFPLEDPPPSVQEDIKILPQLEHCVSKNNAIWLGIIYGYKGLLLLFGLFLSYETRTVKLKMVNDSRYVGMAIYNVAILCVITAPVSLVIASQPDASFAFISFSVVFCCLISMALIFVPKIMELVTYQGNSREEIRQSNNSNGAAEDHQKLQRLLKENEELQRSLDEKDAKIRLLKEKIEEKNKQEMLRAAEAALGDVRAATSASMGFSGATPDSEVTSRVKQRKLAGSTKKAGKRTKFADETDPEDCIRNEPSVSVISRHVASGNTVKSMSENADHRCLLLATPIDRVGHYDRNADETELKSFAGDSEEYLYEGVGENDDLLPRIAGQDENDEPSSCQQHEVRIAADGESESNERILPEDHYFLQLGDGVEVELLKPGRGELTESFL